MADYRTTIRTRLPAAEAFDYMADLRNFEEWDPGVASSTLVEGDEPGPHSEYDVKVGATTLRYRTLEYDAPNRVVVEARSRLLRSYDVIEVTGTEDGCEVEYDATLELNGPLKLADPLLGLFFNRLGDRSATGMQHALRGTKVA